MLFLFCGMCSPQTESVTVRWQVCTGIAGSFSPEFSSSNIEFRSMPATYSGQKWQVSTGISVFGVAGFRRNHWQVWTGICITEKYFKIIQKYDEFGYVIPENLNIIFDSKENFDTIYKSSWFYYYR